MKKRLISMLLAVILLTMPSTQVFAGEMEILVNKLVEKGILTPYEGQILVAQAKEEAAKELAAGKASTAPAWTQKIKLKGDVRFRTQVDWQNNRDDSGGRNVRQRVRARVGVEGKVNDEVSGGVRFVTGSDDSRSTNETLSDDGTFATPEAHLDLYYIKWTPELPNNMGTAAVTGGKMKNPFKKTELLWDSDVNPEGMAGQFMSSNFDLGEVPTNLYLNTGYFMLREDSWLKGVPMMIAVQGGLKMDLISDWDSMLDMSVAYYDFANVTDNVNYRDGVGGQARDGAGTNTLFTTGTANRYRYDFNLVDFIIQYDSKKFFDFEMGHGLYSDLIWNAAPSDNNFAYMVGGYLGTKKPKKPGQWKLWGNWRYIERDAVPDFLPDSDFFGWINETGGVGGGGTNGQGFNCGLQYAVLKNTVLAVEYYYMEPIKLGGNVARDVEPYQLLQFDVKVKF